MFVSVAEGPKGRAIRVGVGMNEVDAMKSAASGLSEFSESVIEAMMGAGEIEAIDPGALNNLSEIAVLAATASKALLMLTDTLTRGRVVQCDSEAELAEGVSETYARGFGGDGSGSGETVSVKDLIARVLGL